MVGRRSGKTIEIRREVLHRAAKKKNLYREEEEAAQQLQLERAQDTLRTTHNTCVAKFRKRANKNYNRSALTKAFNEPLTEGSIYGEKDIPMHTHRRMAQIWTMEKIVSKRVILVHLEPRNATGSHRLRHPHP